MSPPWSERIPAGESTQHDRLAAQIREIQRSRAAGGPALRALHAKANAAARATLRIGDDVPDWARVGIFASAGAYPALVRWSNGAGARQPDLVPDVRGMAVKVAGVPGRKLIPGLEEARTQDFLAILSPSLPFRSPAAFVGLIRATAGPKYLALPRLIGALGLFGFLPTLRALQAGLSRPLPSLAEATFYSPLPIQWGEAAVKFAFFPGDATAPSALARGDDPERLGTDLRARLAGGALSWELRIQRWVDEARTPIEDASVAWDPLVTPWVTVARLELPRQDLGAPEALDRAARIERLSFDPWHAPVAFRPLGAFMRARAAAYRESVAERGVDAEPTGEEGWVRG